MAVAAVAGAEDARQVLPLVTGFHKVTSWLALHVLHLPTLSGVVITPGEVHYMDEVLAFAQENNIRQLLMRTDAQRESGRYPRGGYIVSISDLEAELFPLLSRGRLVFLLEPKSSFNDLYSLGINAWPDDNLVLEVVGPGFDASDLKRGDATPHERWVASRKLEILSRDLISDESYADSWSRRFAKAQTMLSRPVGGADALSGTDLNPADTRALLQSMQETLLLEAEMGYEPMPLKLGVRALEVAAFLGSRLAANGFDDEPLSVSMSYLGKDAEPIWWDVVWPKKKYEAAEPAV